MVKMKGYEQIGTISEGELVMKLPGTDLKMPYKKGEAFVNQAGVGYISLPIRDAYCVKTGQSKGLSGMLGELLAEQLNDPEVKKMLKKTLTRDHHLFYSRAQDGVEMLCLPWIAEENYIDDQSMPNVVLASYTTNGRIPTFKETYAHHLRGVGKRELVTDKNILEREILQLVPKANGVYGQALQTMKEFDF